jgi:hypothetical protein
MLKLELFERGGVGEIRQDKGFGPSMLSGGR